MRQPVPRHVTWEISAVYHFNWLAAARPTDAFVDADCQDNRVQIGVQRPLTELTLSLDERLIDFSRPVVVTVNGRTTEHKVSPSLRVLCETLAERGDPEYMFSARVRVAVPPPAPATKAATGAATRAK